MNETKRTANSREIDHLRFAAGETARRFRIAQAEYDQTRTMTAEYWQAKDAMALAWRLWEAARGY
jgi:hypothetical protein